MTVGLSWISSDSTRTRKTSNRLGWHVVSGRPIDTIDISKNRLDKFIEVR